MSTTTENITGATATDNSATEFAGFQSLAIDATEKGPSLPDSVSTAIPANEAKVLAMLTALGVTDEKVIAEWKSALAGRPAGFLLLSLFPVPRNNEIDNRKARKVFGAGKAIELPIADNENNRLMVTSLLFAQLEKKNEDKGKTDAEKDLENE
jgi:hypothetical protein